MKRLSISDVKDEQFDAIGVVESLFTFDTKDFTKTRTEISYALNECDALIEAIFFKKEKKRKGLNTEMDELLKIQCKKLTAEALNIRPNDFGKSFFILEQKKATNELLKIKRVLRYTLQMDDQAEQILQALIVSENPEEWKFLAEIIYVNTSISKTSNYDIFISFSKKLEEKIVVFFEKSICNIDFNMSKTCFDVLSTLDKEFLLIDEFLMIKNLLATTMDVHPSVSSKIELNSRELKDTTFSIFLDSTYKIIEDNFELICLVFGHHEEYIDYIISKIFRTLISLNLANFLNVTNAPIFLKCLHSAFDNVNSFNDSLSHLFPKFDYKSCTYDIFSPFLFTASIKEKQLFEEILEIFMLGERSVINTYYIHGKKVEKSDDFIFIFQNMMILLDTFMTGSETLYQKDNQRNLYKKDYSNKKDVLQKEGFQADVLNNVAIKLCTLVEKMITFHKSSKLNLINDLIYMYLTNCRFFGDNGESLQMFNDRLIESINSELQELINFSIKFCKNEISNLFFTSSNCHKRLNKYLENLLSNPGRLGEKNFKLFTHKIVTQIYDMLYKQILLIEIGVEEQQRIHLCLDDLFSSLPLNFSGDFLVNFNHLKNFTKAIVVDQSKFEGMKILFTESEIKSLIKCRNKTHRKDKSNESSNTKKE